jgi:steroid 5-alpha reductase family enzyme
MFYLDVVYHAFFVFTALGVIFMTYGAKLESKLVTAKITSAVNDLVLDMRITEDMRAKLLQQGAPSRCEKQTNRTVFGLISFAIFIFFIAAVIATLVAVRQHGMMAVGKVIAINVFVFMFVGVIESLFFLFVVLKYVPLTEAEFYDYYNAAVRETLA